MAQNYVLLERIELNQTASSVTFSNIPQTGYTDLKIVLSIRSDNTDLDTLISFNGSSASFSGKRLYGSGSGVASDSTSRSAGLIDMSSYTASTFANNELYIPNYTGSTNKSFSVDSVTENNATAAYALLAAGLWSNTAAITSITIAPSLGNFVSGSTFSLYGIANANTTPAKAPKADGGNVIATDGTYWYHAFLSNGTFTPQVGLSADVLVVAGGGGGGYERGAGGGAGGLLAFTSQSLSATGYTCTVGAGGTGATGYGTGMTNGVDSQFGALTLVKGGGYGGSGGNSGASVGGAGGSSGGSGYYVQTTTSPSVSGQGNAGGASSTSGASAGGGGGAGAAGTKAVAPAGGAGGVGSSTYSSWGAATLTGQNVSGTYYFAGGGGGGCDNSGTTQGGYGGGGATTAGGATAGTTNTGGGGGGGSFGAGQYNGAAGGSGIIIIRYAVA